MEAESKGRRHSQRTPFRSIALMYHDVIELQDSDASGFPGRGPARYKVDPALFECHLEAIAATGRVPTRAIDLGPASKTHRHRPLFLTFDDGGASAPKIAEALSSRGWPGHFFIPVDYIGRPGFVEQAQIAQLVRLGHVVGSHSCSHPIPISRLPAERILEEWRRSAGVLGEIIGSTVVTGSVPGGYWSPRVVQAAAAAGITMLFTSDPVPTVRELDGCFLLGRYAILAGTTPETAARLARGDLIPRLRQRVSWNAKGAAKLVLGDRYRALRTRLLGTG
jgi:peptidoglycan/xylan/chitin deacetylase (PgdA/CDA1 family)